MKPVLLDYERQVEELCKPHVNWYNIDKPVLNLDKILLNTNNSYIEENIKDKQKNLLFNDQLIIKDNKNPLTYTQ